MMEAQAKVASLDGDYALLEVTASGGCGRCEEPGGCRTGVLNQLFSTRPRHYRLPNSLNLLPGQYVRVRIPDGSVLQASLLVYLLPLICVLVGAFVGQFFATDPTQTDLAALIGAVLGLAAGAAALMFYKSRVAAPAMLALETESASTFCERKST